MCNWAFSLGQTNWVNGVFYQVQCALFHIENNAEIFPAHYTWKVAEKGFKMGFRMNKFAMMIIISIFLPMNIFTIVTNTFLQEGPLEFYITLGCYKAIQGQTLQLIGPNCKKVLRIWSKKLYIISLLITW